MKLNEILGRIISINDITIEGSVALAVFFLPTLVIIILAACLWFPPVVKELTNKRKK